MQGNHPDIFETYLAGAMLDLLQNGTHEKWCLCSFPPFPASPPKQP
jgi:hypothetical protein